MLVIPLSARWEAVQAACIPVLVDLVVAEARQVWMCRARALPTALVSQVVPLALVAHKVVAEALVASGRAAVYRWELAESPLA